MHGFLADISVAIITASAIGIIFHLLKQPVIVGYLIAGIIIGPLIGPQLISSPENIEMISDTGIVLLLFFIGLEMNPRTIARSGKASVIPGIGQFALTLLIGVPFFIWIGMAEGYLQSAYLATACALSSTAIVIKSLYETYETDTLHGQVSIGILVMQDLWALLALTLLPGLSNGGLLITIEIIAKTGLLFLAAILASRVILKHVFVKLTKSPEMTVIASIGWCTVLAGLSAKIGLSPALGALAAGLSISMFPYSVFVTDKMEPLRDLFLMIFFVSLGLKVPLPDMHLMVYTAIIIAFVYASRFIIVYPLVRFAGGSGRTAFISSLNLSQVSEFSLIIMTAGVALEQVSSPQLSSVLYAMTICGIASSYSIKFSHKIHGTFSRFFFRNTGRSDKEIKVAKKYPIIILGVHRGSQALIEMIAKKQPDLLSQILVIDYNPEALNRLHLSGIAGFLGDVSRAEVLEKAGMRHAKIIVATIPSMLLKGTGTNKLVKLCRNIAPNASIIASADFKSHVEELKDAGADRIIMPYFIAGDECANMVIESMEKFSSETD